MSWLIDKSFWLDIYNDIKKMLSLSFDLDQQATNILSTILSTMPNTVDINYLKEMFYRDCIFILGPATNIEHDFAKAESLDITQLCTSIAVNGASSYLYEVGFIPTAIVTDLDGNPIHIIYLNNRGAIAIIHAHGDNINDIIVWVPEFRGHVIGSTQVEPRSYVYNFGGFTDGDRALYIAYVLGAREIFIGGMNFLGNIGRYSITYKNKDKNIKKIKMNIAVKLVEILISWGLKIRSLSATGIDGIGVI